MRNRSSLPATRFARPLRRSLAALLILALALAALPAPARAATWELSRLKPVGGQMLDMAVAGERLFYRATYEEDGGVSLYSVPVSGGRPVQLNASLPYGQVDTFQLSADGTWAVFSLSQRGAQPNNLYSIPSGGGTPIQLNDPAREFSGQQDLSSEMSLWMAAGGRVVYRARGIWLYSVPITGGALTLLSPVPPADDRPYVIREVQLSADGTRVAYTIVQGLTASVYTVPVTGGVPQQVNNAPIDFSQLRWPAPSVDLAISADGSRVAYVMPTPDTGDAPENRALISARSDGGDRRTLASGQELQFQYHAHSGRLVYTTRANWVDSIRSVPIGGGPTAIISDTARTSLALSLSPYSDAGLLHDTYELFQFSIAGGAPTPVDLGGRQMGVDHAFTPDGRYALFTTGLYDASSILFGYNLASGDLWQIGDPLLAASGVGRFWLAPGGERVVYSARTDVSGAGQYALFSAPVRGGQAVRISGPPRPNEPLIGWHVAISPDGGVFYTTGRPVPGSSKAETYYPQLYRAVITGETAPALVHRSRAIVGAVGNIAVSAIDGRVVYVADQEVDGEYNLYSVPIGGGEPLRIGTSITYQMSPLGGALVAIESDRFNTRHIALTRIPIAGGASERIFTPAGQGAYVSDLELTPDGQYAVFILSEQGRKNLYRVPVAGGAAQLLGAEFEWYQLSPDGAFVVYRHKLAEHNVQLMVVRVADGATLWSEAIADISAIAISPDSTRVAFEAAGPSGESAGLAIRSLDGSTTLIGATAVSGIFFTDDSARMVLVRLDVANDVHTYTVFSVPVGGGDPEVLVSTQGSPPFFKMELAGDRLIYHTWHAGSVGGMVEHTLASVPVAGGEPTTLFGPAERPNRTLMFQAISDGSQVLYALHDTAWVVPITGGAATKLIDGAQVEGFHLTEDGRVVMLDTSGGLTINRLSGGARRRLNDPFSRVRSVVLAGDKAIYTASPKGVSLYAADLLDALDLDQRVYLPLLARGEIL